VSHRSSCCCRTRCTGRTWRRQAASVTPICPARRSALLQPAPVAAPCESLCDGHSVPNPKVNTRCFRLSEGSRKPSSLPSCCTQSPHSTLCKPEIACRICPVRGAAWLPQLLPPPAAAALAAVAAAAVAPPREAISTRDVCIFMQPRRRPDVGRSQVPKGQGFRV